MHQVVGRRLQPLYCQVLKGEREDGRQHDQEKWPGLVDKS